MSITQLKLAEKIIRDYNEVIKLTDTGYLGLPEFMLGRDKSQIKQALLVALSELDADEADLRETLIQSFLYLARFVPKRKAEIIRRGQEAIMSGNPNHPDLEYGDEAVKIINEIKAEMEELRFEVYAYIKRKAEEKACLEHKNHDSEK